jgi:uncharacterized membrane protein
VDFQAAAGVLAAAVHRADGNKGTERMNLLRVIRHLYLNPWLANRLLPRRSRDRIEQAIRESEKRHSGEIRVAVESALGTIPLIKGQTPHMRALAVFSSLRVWDTAQNNGVLIYVLLADRYVEIVADRGIHVPAGENAWKAICKGMESYFRNSDFEAGIMLGIARITDELVRRFPPRKDDANELPDSVAIV